MLNINSFLSVYAYVHMSTLEYASRLTGVILAGFAGSDAWLRRLRRRRGGGWGVGCAGECGVEDV